MVVLIISQGPNIYLRDTWAEYSLLVRESCYVPMFDQGIALSINLRSMVSVPTRFDSVMPRPTLSKPSSTGL